MPVRRPDEIFNAIEDTAPDPATISIAEKIIEQQQGPFDASTFVDRYEAALKKLIAEKEKGHEVRAIAEPDDTNVVDLMPHCGPASPAAARPARTARRQGGKAARRQGGK